MTTKTTTTVPEKVVDTTLLKKIKSYIQYGLASLEKRYRLEGYGFDKEVKLDFNGSGAFGHMKQVIKKDTFYDHWVKTGEDLSRSLPKDYYPLTHRNFNGECREHTPTNQVNDIKNQKPKSKMGDKAEICFQVSTKIASLTLEEKQAIKKLPTIVLEVSGYIVTVN